MLKFALVAALSLSVIAVAPLTQSTVQQPAPVFRTSINLVHFAVSVLDRNRRSVKGLTADDFAVSEDGKPQRIAAFAAVEVPAPEPSPPASWAAEVSPDIQRNERRQNTPEGRLVVLLLDDALLPGDPAAVQNAKRIARGVVDRLSPVDQVAVVFTLASRNAQDFTTDRRKLLAAIDSLHAGPSVHLLGWDAAVPRDPRNARSILVPAVDMDSQLRSGTVRTLQSIADALVTAPQTRKLLVFVSPGVAADALSAARPTKPGVDPGGPIRDANRTLVSAVKETFDHLARANVTVYSFDPFGLDGLRNYVMSHAMGLPEVARATDPVPPFYDWFQPTVAPRPEDLAAQVAAIEHDFLEAASANTGGRAIVNSNNFDSALDTMFEENGSYYLIGYEPPAKNRPLSVHHIGVKVNKPDLMVRAQREYVVDASVLPPKGSGAGAVEKLALDQALAGPVNKTGLPLTVALAPFMPPVIRSASGSSNRTSPRAGVTIVLGFESSPIVARTAEVIDLVVQAFRPDGAAVGSALRQTARFTLVPIPGADVLRYEVLMQVGSLDAGRYVLRAAARRATDGSIGSVYADVEVPDFRAPSLSVSGVWIEASPGPSAIPPNAFAGLLPGVPTALREFKPTDRVGAFYFIYENGIAAPAAVTAHMSVINAQGAALTRTSRNIPAEQFDGTTLAAMDRFALPIGDLQPGQYLLRIDVEAAGAMPIRRNVVFTVR